MRTDNIYIFTDVIHSGKTTILQQWLEHNPIKAGGILTPDRDGKRKLYDISRDSWHELETKEGHPLSDVLAIGKYNFSKYGFRLAQEILLRSVKENHDWVIADEVGRLELDEKTGLEPTLSEIINVYKNGNTSGNLLLIVRDYLVDEVINMYALNRNLIVYKSFFE